MLKIIIMSDIHIMQPEEIKFGLDTAERFKKAIKDVNDFHSDADLCIYAGDIADAGQVSSYQLFDKIREENPIKSYVMMGNHDDRNVYIQYNQDAMVDNNGFVQGSIETKGYRVIMLDSSEPGHVEGILCEQRLAWLRDELALAAQANTPVILVLHHTANSLHMPVDTYKLSNADDLANTLKESDAQIAQIISGHCHISTAGSWHGFPVATLSGNQHRVGGFFKNTPGQQPCFEGPAQFLVLFANETGVTVHFHNYIDRNLKLPDAMFPRKKKQLFADE